jgi:hypothetical protein
LFAKGNVTLLTGLWKTGKTTLLSLVIDYQDGFQANWHVLTMIFEDTPQKLTREDILGEWPTDFDRPSASTLRSWLDRAVARSLVACAGRAASCSSTVGPVPVAILRRCRAGNTSRTKASGLMVFGCAPRSSENR